MSLKYEPASEPLHHTRPRGGAGPGVGVVARVREPRGKVVERAPPSDVVHHDRPRRPPVVAAHTLPSVCVCVCVCARVR